MHISYKDYSFTESDLGDDYGKVDISFIDGTDTHNNWLVKLANGQTFKMLLPKSIMPDTWLNKAVRNPVRYKEILPVLMDFFRR